MEQKLNALIVDDEEKARALLKKLLEETLFFKDIRSARSVSSAKSDLSTFEPDIIFLDIRMPGKDGFAFLHDLPSGYKQNRIVFVTAYEQYAIKAIKNGAFDYLLKPVNRNELLQCITRFVESRGGNMIYNMQKQDIVKEDGITRLRISTRAGTLFINPYKILFCEADGNYTTIHTGEKQHLCSMNIGKVEEFLPKKRFLRIGRSHIINLEFITLVDRKLSNITLVREGKSVTIKLPRKHLKELDSF